MHSKSTPPTLVNAAGHAGASTATVSREANNMVPADLKKTDWLSGWHGHWENK